VFGNELEKPSTQKVEEFYKLMGSQYHKTKAKGLPNLIKEAG